MNWEILTNSKLVENLGWTLVHSIWQIILAASVLFLISRASKSFSANLRYLFSVAALAAAFLLPLATFVFLSGNSRHLPAAGISEAKNTNPEKNGLRRQESLPVSDNNRRPGPADSAYENISVSFEVLSGNFRQKLASALPAFVWLWIFGVGVYTFRLAGGVWQLHKYKTREIYEPRPEWREKFSDLCRKFGITQAVKLRRSGLVKTPVVVGWLRPLILVPAGVFLQMNPRELETILAHELVHIRRYDNLVNFAQSFVEILFFYHPCAWWISGSIRREREYACDDAVLETLDSPRFVYADALANLEEIRLRTNEKTPRLLVAASGGKLMKRIERIVEKNAELQASSKQSFWSASLALLLISAVLINVFSAQNALSVNAGMSAADKKIAIGFVSLPPLDRIGPPQDSGATMRLLIEKLKSRRIPAIGFVQGSMISDGEKLFPVRADNVRAWRDAGFEVGIGGFRHLWFFDTPYDSYVANVEKNEKITKALLAEKNLPLRYFSYPFLNTGKTAEDKNRFEAWLKERGLRSVPYTFDNQEWMYSFAYDIARKDNDADTMKAVRAEFLDYMAKMLAHFEAYSKEMFGRDIAQTLVLSPSRLVTDTADELFGMFEKQGYRFVSMDEALADEAYKTPENFTGSKSGISWFERWQLSQNKKLRDEPGVSKLVDNIWNQRKGGK